MILALLVVLRILFLIFNDIKIQEWIFFGIDDLCVFVRKKIIIIKGENIVKIRVIAKRL